MKRIRKYLRKVSGSSLVDQTGELQESTDRLLASAHRFKNAIESYAVTEATADLLHRIEALEAEIRAMKNGTGHYPKIKL